MNETTPDAQRWQTCIHEAGHAAAALLLGVEGIGAVVFDEGGGVATPKPATATMPLASDYEPTKLDESHRFKNWPALLCDATFAAAGQAAVDLVLYPERNETVCAGGDAELLHAAARSACPGADFYVQMYFAAMAAARARALLKPRLCRVKLAAKELNRRGRMTAEQIVAAMFPEHVHPDTSSPQADTPA